MSTRENLQNQQWAEIMYGPPEETGETIEIGETAYQKQTKPQPENKPAPPKPAKQENPMEPPLAEPHPKLNWEQSAKTAHIHRYNTQFIPIENNLAIRGEIFHGTAQQDYHLSVSRQEIKPETEKHIHLRGNHIGKTTTLHEGIQQVEKAMFHIIQTKTLPNDPNPTQKENQ